MICKLCRVTGRVQGVFFRASTQQHARLLKVNGYAKNCSDGCVEVLACGEPDNVSRLCEWLKKGPEYAKVENLECSNHDLVKTNSFYTS
jgi:acylphosphatase